MNPEQQQKIHNPLSAMADGEQIIFNIKRHPFGLLMMYLSFGFLLAILVAMVFIAPDVLTDYDSVLVRKICLVVLLVAIGFVIVISLITHIVYYGNRWVLTSDSLTQISQNGIFDKHNSQLSLANLEDVSAIQDGIFAHMLNYGVLRAETAGERSKFSFIYCPNPNKYAQQILMAREAFEQGGQYRSTEPNGVNINT